MSTTVFTRNASTVAKAYRNCNCNPVILYIGWTSIFVLQSTLFVHLCNGALLVLLSVSYRFPITPACISTWFALPMKSMCKRTCTDVCALHALLQTRTARNYFVSRKSCNMQGTVSFILTFWNSVRGWRRLHDRLGRTKQRLHSKQRRKTLLFVLVLAQEKRS